MHLLSWLKWVSETSQLTWQMLQLLFVALRSQESKTRVDFKTIQCFLSTVYIPYIVLNRFSIYRSHTWLKDHLVNLQPYWCHSITCLLVLYNTCSGHRPVKDPHLSPAVHVADVCIMLCGFMVICSHFLSLHGCIVSHSYYLCFLDFSI